jgi:hypothetical protein
MSSAMAVLFLILGLTGFAQAQLLTQHQVIRCVEFQDQVDPFDDGSVIAINMGDCEYSKFDLQLLNSRVMQGLQTVLKSKSIGRQTLYSELVAKYKFDLEKMRQVQSWVASSLRNQDSCTPEFYGSFSENVIKHLRSPETVKKTNGYVNAYEITKQFALNMTCKQ